MKNLYEKQLLILQSKRKQPFKLTIEGTSMLPVLHPGNCISICAKEDYIVGDILVFFYKNDTLLVHRLLKIENGRYFCKGDNSFRLEDVEKNVRARRFYARSPIRQNVAFRTRHCFRRSIQPCCFRRCCYTQPNAG